MKQVISRKFLVVLAMSALTLAACGEQTGSLQPPNPPLTKTPTLTTEVKAPASLDITENKDSGQVSTAVDNSEVTFATLKNLDTNKVLAPYKAAMIKAQEDMLKGADPTATPTVRWQDDIASYYKFYDAGEITVAPYKGQRLVVLDMGCDGPCGSAVINRFAMDEKTGKLTWFPRLSNQDWSADHFKPLEKDANADFTIKALDIPNSIMLPDGKNSAKLELMGLDIEKTAQDKVPDATGNVAYDFVTPGKVAFHDAKWGDIYFIEASSNSGCLLVKTPDGVISSFSYDPGFQDEKHFQSVKWTDGSDQSSLTSEYSPLFRGCGVGNSCYFVEDIKEDLLVQVGKSTNGLAIYSAKDSKLKKVNTSEAVVGDPNTTLNQTYNSYSDMYQFYDDATKQAHPKKTYAEFLKSHPVIYWKDPFGRFSAFIQNDVKPPAECGKPVIYLYPEKTSTVHVKVGIDQFTKTVPAYGDNGWSVEAQPNGVLKNLADGLTYPYLFWEGISKKQVAINGGFVVEKKDLGSFLSGSLAKLGLNEKESADFQAFWLPKMAAVDAPYLQVSFVGTSDFNKVAPLSISPRPDTLIRVFMYYQPASKTTVLPAQKLSSLARRGFTVVEWGGTSSDGWQIK